MQDLQVMEHSSTVKIISAKMQLHFGYLSVQQYWYTIYKPATFLLFSLERSENKWGFVNYKKRLHLIDYHDTLVPSNINLQIPSITLCILLTATTSVHRRNIKTFGHIIKVSCCVTCNLKCGKYIGIKLSHATALFNSSKNCPIAYFPYSV